MKQAPSARKSISSAAIISTMVMTLGCSALLILTTYAADPAWWSSRGAVVAEQIVTNNGVVTTNHVPNGYAVATQGQLKQFTARAVDELNADLTNNGGSGPALSNLVYGWQQDYLTNGYATNTASPAYPYKSSDLQVVNVGQLKYIASLVYDQLASAGYTELTPSWIVQNTNTDNVVANLGQLKEVFDFDLTLGSSSNLTASANVSGTMNLSWTLPTDNQAASYLIEQQTVGGSWNVIATISDPLTTSYAVTNLTSGENPEFQIIAQNGRSASLAQTTPNDPALIAPSNVNGTAGAAPGEIDLTWQNNATDATYITINESADGVNWTPIANISPTATSYAVTNLTVGLAYYFGVSAGNN